MAPSRALIIGITGQDGSYLAEFLLARGYQVHGVVRRASSLNTARLDHLYRDHHDLDPTAPGLILHHGDLTDGSGLRRLLNTVKPHEIYNLGAMSHVRVSFDTPEYTANVDGLGTLRILEAVRLLGLTDKTRIYQASTSELYGLVQEVPQSEKTPFYPRSPYGVAKLYGHWITKNYRESYDMFNVSGILFNHESERRGIEFVTRKISDGVAKIYCGLQDKIILGNLDSKRDWGYAPDYVESMWLMLQQNKPDDYVIATGKAHSIREFLDRAFKHIGIIDWSGYVGEDERYMRPAEVDVLRGDSTKAREVLGWKPKTSFDQMVNKMVSSDIKRLENRNG